eukprot:sb/3470830/
MPVERICVYRGALSRADFPERVREIQQHVNSQPALTYVRTVLFSHCIIFSTVPGERLEIFLLESPDGYSGDATRNSIPYYGGFYFKYEYVYYFRTVLFSPAGERLEISLRVSKVGHGFLVRVSELCRNNGDSCENKNYGSTLDQFLGNFFYNFLSKIRKFIYHSFIHFSFIYDVSILIFHHYAIFLWLEFIFLMNS